MFQTSVSGPSSVVRCTVLVLLVSSLAVGDVPANAARAHFSDGETAVGNWNDQLVVSTGILLVDERVEVRVQAIIDRLTKAAGAPSCSVRVLNSPEINAYAVPGGRLYVTTGLLELTESEDELAAALAHELVHTAEDHLRKQWTLDQEHVRTAQLSITIATTILATAAGAAAGAATAKNTGSPAAGAGVAQGTATLAALMFGAITSEAASYAVIRMSRGYARELELQADREALGIARAAGYQPRALIALLKRFDYLETTVQDFRGQHLASHFLNAEPGLGDRIRILEASGASS